MKTKLKRRMLGILVRICFLSLMFFLLWLTLGSELIFTVMKIISVGGRRQMVALCFLFLLTGLIVGLTADDNFCPALCSYRFSSKKFFTDLATFVVFLVLAYLSFFIFFKLRYYYGKYGK